MVKIFCRILFALSWIAPCLLIFTVGMLIFFLGYNGIPAITSRLFFGETPALDALLGLRPVWDGIWIALVGTASLVAMTTLFVLFPGIGCGIYLAEYATPKERKYIGALIDVLAGTPSILMGFTGFLLILVLRKTFFPQATTCLLLAAFCLALLVLPVLIVATREALQNVPQDLRLTAKALGFTPQQSLWHIFLPSASRSIISGLVLTIGRTAEDTAVILLTGVVASTGLPAGLLDKFEALPFFIYYTAAEYHDKAELMRGFAASFLLLSFSVCLLLLAKTLRKYTQKGI